MKTSEVWLGPETWRAQLGFPPETCVCVCVYLWDWLPSLLHNSSSSLTAEWDTSLRALMLLFVWVSLHPLHKNIFFCLFAFQSCGSVSGNCVNTEVCVLISSSKALTIIQLGVRVKLRAWRFSELSISCEHTAQHRLQPVSCVSHCVHLQKHLNISPIETLELCL